MTEIRLALISDISTYKQHIERHGKESGNDGDPIFSPYEKPWDPPEDKLLQDKSASWSKPVSVPGWERCWILTDFNQIYGDIKLVQQPPLSTALHRATLMMGIERSHRKQGWGLRLIEEALAWARTQSSLEWIDLYVFAENKPAIALYMKAGFREVARVPDLFRINGQKIEDIHMTLQLFRDER